MERRNAAEATLARLVARGADEARSILVRSERHELALDDRDLSMLRTTRGDGLGLTFVKDMKRGQIAVNQLDEEILDEAVSRCARLCEGGKPDVGNRLAPAQPAERFAYGAAEPDIDAMCDRLKEFSDGVKTAYPTVVLRSATLSFDASVERHLNSNGVDFETRGSHYAFRATFCAKDGGRTSSFCHAGFLAADLGSALVDGGSVGTLLGRIGGQLEPRAIAGSFEGEVVVAPDCLATMLSLSFRPLMDGSMMAGTSIHSGRLGHEIAARGLTVDFEPVAGVRKRYVSSDGFKTRDVRLIDAGVLGSYLLSHRAALKTGLERAGNDGTGMVVASGEASLDEIVKSVGKGLLLYRFSGDSPNENGDFSGVAKNSYYIENGEILYPVAETMIAGNTASFLMGIRALSRERVDFGDAILPWACAGGIVVSGK